MNFENGDFVAVEEAYIIGVVRPGRKTVTIVTGSMRTQVTEIEIWFGDLMECGLPLTFYVAENKLVNIKGAKYSRPFYQRKHNVEKKYLQDGNQGCE